MASGSMKANCWVHEQVRVRELPFSDGSDPGDGAELRMYQVAPLLERQPS